MALRKLQAVLLTKNIKPDNILEFIDQYIKDTESHTTLHFGKWSGFSVEQLSNTVKGRDYLKWLLKQQWLEKDQYKYIRDDCVKYNITKPAPINKVDQLTLLDTPSYISRLQAKASGYNQQDKAKGRLTYNDKYSAWSSPLLTRELIIGIIKKQGLTCSYCTKLCDIIPIARHHPSQMTLDRIDNDKTHTVNNLVVSCWSCNSMRSNDYTSKHFRRIKRYTKKEG